MKWQGTCSCLFVFLAMTSQLPGAIYRVGPEQPLSEVNDVPWEALEPGDEVLIHWRTEPYRAKWVICRSGTAEAPICIRGVPGPRSERPVIDGRDAVTRPALNFWGEERGVVKIGGANRPPDTTPAHIVVEGLEIRSGRPPYSFTGRSGVTAYAKNAASVFIEKGRQIVVRDCVLHDSGNGLFVSPQSSEILIEGCRIYGNGIEGSIYEHNSYTESAGITFQFNHYGPLRAGCPGNNLKDRSSGLIVRYNQIQDGNRQLDLVDATADERITSDPRYRKTFVYGNVLVESEGQGNGQIVHYGGDSGKPSWYRRGVLYFYHNTVLSTREGTTTLLRLSSPDERAECWNNILYCTAPGRHFAVMNAQGTLLLHHNWLPEGWRSSHGEFSGTIDARDNLVGHEPGLGSERGLFHLAAGSPCIDAGSDLPAAALPVERQIQGRSSVPRRSDGRPDLGAFEK
jgi:hypothetical protein